MIRSIIGTIYFNTSLIMANKKCWVNVTDKPLHQAMLQLVYRDYFIVLPYNFFFAIYMIYMNLSLTFTLPIFESFFVMFSILLSEEFEFFNKQLEKDGNCINVEKRLAQHESLCKLVQEVNRFLSFGLLKLLTSSLIVCCIKILSNVM